MSLPPSGGCQLADWGCYDCQAKERRIISVRVTQMSLPPSGGCQLADWGCYCHSSINMLNKRC